MNKWKIAFWVCFTTLIFVMGFSIYSIIDQAYTITYMKDGYTATEKNLDLLTNIINKSDLSKSQIKNLLKQDTRYDFINFDTDSVSLDGITLIFKDDKLIKVNH